MENKLRYPLEINDVVRKQTFYVNSHLSPANPDEGESPLKIFGHWSRYEFCVINENKKAATANIDFASMRKILRRADTYFKMHMQMETKNSSQSESIAYTTKLTGKYKGAKSPADILLEKGEQGKFELDGQRAWLEENLSKYRKNQEQIDAIDEAMRLFNAGRLDKNKASSNVRTIYLATTRPLLRRKAPKFVLDTYKPIQQEVIHPCYEIKITWNLGESGYPVNVTIVNYYAPVIRNPDKTINVLKSQRCKADGASVVNSMNLSVDEWMDTIENIKADINMFRLLYAKKMYTTAMNADRQTRSDYVSQSRQPVNDSNNQPVQARDQNSAPAPTQPQQTANPVNHASFQNPYYGDGMNGGNYDTDSEWGDMAPAAQSSTLDITNDDLPF